MKKLLSAGLALLFALTSVFSVLAAPPVPPVRAPAASGSNAIDLDGLMSGRLPVASNSDALSDGLLDESFSVIPYSSLDEINNTVGFDDMWLYVDMYDINGKFMGNVQTPVDDRGHAVLRMRPDCTYFFFAIILRGTSLPSSGKYTFTVDFSSDMSVVWGDTLFVRGSKSYNNAETDETVSKTFAVR